MEETEIQIQVRSLSGESTAISISPTITIRDLKLLLKQRFPPASTSPDFHLFLRGMKLGLQSQIGSHSIKSGEFIALMPFTKKGKSRHSQESEAPSQTCNQSVPANLAESTWRDMMEDLSHLNETSNCEKQPGGLPNDFSDIQPGHTIDDNCAGSYSSKKCRKMSPFDDKAGLSEELISSILQSPGKHTLDEDLCKKFLNVLESVHCLSDMKTEKCALLSNADIQRSGQPSCSCICPPWLKLKMKAFTFLNILAGLLQMLKEIVTLDRVKGSLDKLRELGFCVSIEDLKHLQILCPKIVHFVEQEAEIKLSLNVIVIFDFSREKRDETRVGFITARKVSMSKIISSIKKRQTLFRTTLQDALSLLMVCRC